MERDREPRGRPGGRGHEWPGSPRALADAGFISFEPVGTQGDGFSPASLSGGDVRVLLIDGTNGQVNGNEVLAPFGNTLAANRLRLVVGDVFAQKDKGPKRGTTLTSIREDDALKQAVSPSTTSTSWKDGFLRARTCRHEPQRGRAVRVRDGGRRRARRNGRTIVVRWSVSRSAAGMGVAAGASRG